LSGGLLLEELQRRKTHNPRYSLRSFAKHLGISPGHLSSLISGKKSLTVRQASLIANRLKLSPAKKQKLLDAVAPVLQSQGTLDMRQLQEDEFALISEWYHLAILSLARLPKVNLQARSIARRLGITEAQTESALNRLIHLGFLAKSNGRLSRTVKPLQTTTDVPSEAIRRYHRQILDVAKARNDLVPVERKAFTTMTLPINVGKLPVAKKMIDDFNDRICLELEDGELQDVYALCVQLFPVCEEDK
jgi:uncharacterized protein (TIGR02147 family)